jgi:hypothetical protein
MEIMMDSKEILMYRLKFEFANLAVDLQKRALEFSNPECRMREGVIELAQIGVRLTLDEKPAGNMRDHLATQIASEFIDSLE